MHRLLRLAPTLLLAPAAGPTACGCDASALAGINVSVVDARTGNRIEGGAHAYAADGAYTDSLYYADPHASGSIMPLARERAGTYTVVVRRDGYAPYTQTGVRVERGSCHVRTMWVTARLQPLG